PAHRGCGRFRGRRRRARHAARGSDRPGGSRTGLSLPHGRIDTIYRRAPNEIGRGPAFFVTQKDTTMAAYTAADVKNLRERTGAGMMDCKKALDEAGGDFEAAVDALRARGLAAAAKKSSRTAAE